MGVQNVPRGDGGMLGGYPTAVLTAEAVGGAWRTGLPAGEPDGTILAGVGGPGRMACGDTGDWRKEKREKRVSGKEEEKRTERGWALGRAAAPDWLWKHPTPSVSRNLSKWRTLNPLC